MIWDFFKANESSANERFLPSRATASLTVAVTAEPPSIASSLARIGVFTPTAEPSGVSASPKIQI